MFEYNCKMVRVVDGDTVDVDIDLGFGVWLRDERVRIMGIDTPESRTRDKEEKKFGLAAKENSFSKIGSSIINIYSRSPSLIAMGASTVDTISNGRLILGLGTSSGPIVENFNGNSFDTPVQRMKEYVDKQNLLLPIVQEPKCREINPSTTFL